VRRPSAIALSYINHHPKKRRVIISGDCSISSQITATSAFEMTGALADIVPKLRDVLSDFIRFLAETCRAMIQNPQRQRNVEALATKSLVLVKLRDVFDKMEANNVTDKASPKTDPLLFSGIEELLLAQAYKDVLDAFSLPALRPETSASVRDILTRDENSSLSLVLSKLKRSYLASRDQRLWALEQEHQSTNLDFGTFRQHGTLESDLEFVVVTGTMTNKEVVEEMGDYDSDMETAWCIGTATPPESCEVTIPFKWVTAYSGLEPDDGPRRILASQFSPCTSSEVHPGLRPQATEDQPEENDLLTEQMIRLREAWNVRHRHDADNPTAIEASGLEGSSNASAQPIQPEIREASVGESDSRRYSDTVPLTDVSTTRSQLQAGQAPSAQSSVLAAIISSLEDMLLHSHA
jgi:hypothetical protein